MLTKKQNDLICSVGAGTPGGEWFRRYWIAAGYSADFKPGGQPRAIRLLGEDLVMFRDVDGQMGLLGLRCSHRLTSLAYGRVEDGGIRCPFHGWVYDVHGHCLEQPAEPAGSTFKDRIRHPSYPCEELGGVVFAYMGPPDRKPLLPRYEVLVREDGARRHYFDVSGGNYLQHLEGAVDTAHFSYLHQFNWSKVKDLVRQFETPEMEFVETDWGIRHTSDLPHVAYNNVLRVYTHFFMPAGFMLLRGNFESGGREGIVKNQAWFTPIDDTNTMRINVSWAPDASLLRPITDQMVPGQVVPGGNGSYDAYVRPVTKDYYRDYDNVDTIHGIPMNHFRAQDIMVNESQGDVCDRTREHLGAQDHIVTLTRKLMLQGIEDVRQGRDPKHIIRDPEENEIYYVRGPELAEHV